MEREKLLSRLPLSREGAKLLVLSGGGPHADLRRISRRASRVHHDASNHGISRDDPRHADTTAQFNEQFERNQGDRRVVRRQLASAAHWHRGNDL